MIGIATGLQRKLTVKAQESCDFQWMKTGAGSKVEHHCIEIKHYFRSPVCE